MTDARPGAGQASHPILPNRLRSGDRLGVVAPSSAVTGEQQAQLEHGVGVLKGMGFEVVLGRHVTSNTLGYAATPQEKAEDIHEMFADPTIQAVICAQGGATANACLPHLDWELIRAHPKIFLGISDITVLLNAIYSRTGLVTFHGNDLLWGFGRTPTAYDTDEFTRRLVEGQIGMVPANRGRVTVRAGTAEGPLLGGNLTCILKLAGTPYFPNLTGAILFLEAFRPELEEVDVMLTQLLEMGIFEQVRGVVTGYIDGLDDLVEKPATLEGILLRLTVGARFPILKANDFGHNCPNTTLPVGGRVRLDAGRQTLAILDPCVR